MDYVCFGFGAPLDACGDPVRLAAIGSEISRVRTARNRSAEVYSSRPHLLTNPLSDRPNSFTGSENRLSAEKSNLSINDSFGHLLTACLRAPSTIGPESVRASAL